jgi:hypothetical protein
MSGTGYIPGRHRHEVVLRAVLPSAAEPHRVQEPHGGCVGCAVNKAALEPPGGGGRTHQPVEGGAEAVRVEERVLPQLHLARHPAAVGQVRAPDAARDPPRADGDVLVLVLEKALDSVLKRERC